jgi:ubiquinone/menaquinone biosynthesis C-methylase UbiE
MHTNNSFYDLIANDYERLLTESDRSARDEVKNLFLNFVRDGIVLDFGGGTGLDLDWISKNNSRILFLEPSDGMRAKALDRASAFDNVTVMDNDLDFNMWSEKHLPFVEKVDGVLANFAVLNCIEDIETLFDKLALISHKGSYFVATIINSSPLKLFKTYSFFAALKLFFSSTLTIKNHYKGEDRETYIHSVRSLKNGCNDKFELIKQVPLEFSDLSVLVFIKK